MRKTLIFLSLLALTAVSCHRSPTPPQQAARLVPAFSADTVLRLCREQCAMGPRVMNSRAHDACREWIRRQFESRGLTVTEQEATLTGYDGTPLRSVNICATTDTTQRRPRILLCAHWDSRPWADNDPDSANWRRPVPAANDGASGVAVMIEIARLLTKADTARVAVDFLCLDAEDWGTPQWYGGESRVSDPWALGAQHFAREYAAGRWPRKYRYAVLLDMVGGEGATFAQEGCSRDMAPETVAKIWQAAARAGHAQLFPATAGSYVEDDHVPLNRVAAIPAADIIAYYPNCPQSSFGPTWHTVADTPERLSTTTLQGVGETLMELIFSE